MENIIYKALFALWSIPTAFFTFAAFVRTEMLLTGAAGLETTFNYIMLLLFGIGALIFLTIDVLILGKARG